MGVVLAFSLTAALFGWLEVDSLRSHNIHLSDNIADLRGDVSELKDLNTQWKDHTSKLNDRIGDLKGNITILEEINTSWKDHVSKLDSRISVLKADNHVLENNVESWKDHASVLEDDNELLLEYAADLEDEVVVSVNLISDLSSAKENLELENVELLSETNPVLKGLLKGELTYYVEPLPSYSTYDTSLFNDYLNGHNIEGIQARQVFDKNNADFSIRWVKDYGPETLGVAYSQRTATVGLGSTNCVNNWQHFDDFTITKIAWHEIGHVLGYGHSDDPNNIMYPTTHTKYNHDSDIKDVISGGWYHPYKFCNGGEQYYKLMTVDQKNYGFKVFVLTPETNTKNFITNNEGRYYPDCGELDKNWSSKSETCNIAHGSKLVIHNTNDKALKIEGYIQNREPHPDIDFGWDSDAYQYDEAYLDYIRQLRK